MAGRTKGASPEISTGKRVVAGNGNRGEHGMDKKKLHMIGNSHIDPVWFWSYEEGMQEVKATFASALDRLREFTEVKFSCTSTAFFEWLEIIQPEMLNEIKERVQEGRLEILGGWFIEPDCLMPNGEAFVRQGLYGQRYLKRTFRDICHIGANVDSFGHTAAFPQILKKSGLDAYVFMRPRIDTPLFLWEARDGSRVKAVNLPAEYTTWFHEPTIKNINVTLERSQAYQTMVCCYGVGNHGGGPTIENIKSIQRLQQEREDVDLVFSTYQEFLQEVDTTGLPVHSETFEMVNTGCYSIDAEFKRRNRLAETRLLQADHYMSMAKGITGIWPEQWEQMEALWKTLLFNQFHDTLGGVIIRSAREEAMMQLSAVCAKTAYIKHLAVQSIINRIDTGGVGYPLFLFNASGIDYEDEVEVELEWFCQSPLKLYHPNGEELAYQRIHTDAKVRHTTLGGRRRLVFHAHIPPFGYAMYRVSKEEPRLCGNDRMEIKNSDPYVLENRYIKAVFDQTGRLSSLLDRETGFDALRHPVTMQIYIDEREAWGGVFKSRYEKSEERFTFLSIDKIESGDLRESVRICSKWEGTALEQIFTLGAEEKELRLELRLLFAHRWRQLKLKLGTGSTAVHTRAETAYGITDRTIRHDGREYQMQRFLDVGDEKGQGLAIANNGLYAFHMEDENTFLSLTRSAIYAQGESPDWYNETETYQYTDLGMHYFNLVLKPHGTRLPVRELNRLAEKAANPYHYLLDCVHQGEMKQVMSSLADTDQPNVAVKLIKKAEDDQGYILRLLELESRDCAFNLRIQDETYSLTIGHDELLTIKIENGTAKRVNLLEWED